jgi:hypothetical protein
MRPFFKDEGFNFQTEIALGATYHQAADVGEVLSTVERIRNGQAQSWVDEWSVTADRLTVSRSPSWIPVSSMYLRPCSGRFLISW